LESLHWSRLIEDGTGIDVIYLDFQKAFDKVPHRHLLIMTKLNAYGIQSDLFNWQKFFSNRKQRVPVHRSYSDCVISGVPQGSVSGPTLFIIYYVNDLPDVLQSFSGLFADDTNLYSPTSSPIDIDL